MMDFATFQNVFKEHTGGYGFHPWQQTLIQDPVCRSRLIRIPTGLGKTLGVLNAWAFHRLCCQDESWPRRLVWCLPMRTLTEQTAREARAFLDSIGSQNVGVHILMGGEDAGDWTQHPDKSAILVGTQDMLLSASLNRGYGLGRAAWPRAMGLLHTDCLWVMDEVQLMDVGLATSGQLQSFWDTRAKSVEGFDRPRVTWWMSATLQPGWLKTPETATGLPALEKGLLETQPQERTGSAWDATKPMACIEEAWEPGAWAEHVIKGHGEHHVNDDQSRQTLVVVNRVEHACHLYDTVQNKIKNEGLEGMEVCLIHSRYRPHERKQWSQTLLRKPKPGDTPINRILIATQVVEAGVDISATHMMTALAPWPSLVQRFGRAARWGGEAKVTVLIDPVVCEQDKEAAPYSAVELSAAAEAARGLEDAGLASLLDHEAKMAQEDLEKLYPYQPAHVLVQKEWEELFDTSTDLTGGDLDVGRFIRSGEERDVLVFWRQWDAGEDGKEVPPSTDIRPQREELCRVPAKGKAGAEGWIGKLGKNQAYRWDFGDGQWEVLRGEPRLTPGSLILVRAEAGGYDPDMGFVGHTQKSAAVEIVPLPGAGGGRVDCALSGDDRQLAGDAMATSEGYQTIATHGYHAGEKVAAYADAVGLSPKLRELLHLAMRLHDWGKAHPAFACCYGVEPERSDLAKAPPAAWVKGFQNMYKSPTCGHRRGFRHELASALGLLGWLYANDPWHPALLGSFKALVEAGGFEPKLPAEASGQNDAESSDLYKQVHALTAMEFDLVLYLLAAHHGKVRGALTPTEQDRAFRPPPEGSHLMRDPVRGVCVGDCLPSIQLCDERGNPIQMPEVELDADLAGVGLSEKFGRSWSERVLGLLEAYGPFALGYLEALVRAADVAASKDAEQAPPDPLLAGLSLRPNAPKSSDANKEGSDERQ